MRVCCSYQPKRVSGEHTRRIITPVPFLHRLPHVATTINLWRVIAQTRFCLNGQPCNSWTRVTAGTDAPGILARMPSPIFRGRWERRWGTARHSSCPLSSENMPVMWFYDLTNDDELIVWLAWIGKKLSSLLFYVTRAAYYFIIANQSMSRANNKIYL